MHVRSQKDEYGPASDFVTAAMRRYVHIFHARHADGGKHRSGRFGAEMQGSSKVLSFIFTSIQLSDPSIVCFMQQRQMKRDFDRYRDAGYHLVRAIMRLIAACRIVRISMMILLTSPSYFQPSSRSACASRKGELTQTR